VASGELTATVAWAGIDGRLSAGPGGQRWFVPHADEVDRVVLVVPGPGVVTLRPTDLEVHRLEALDRSRSLSRIVVPDSVMEGLDAAPLTDDQLQSAIRRATTALAAEMVGVGRWLQETTVAYVTDRVQFGRPVGSFQGLQWELVDTALVQERATAAVYYAAMCVDAEDADASSATHVAKAAAGRAARGWSRTGVQAHGGVGYTWEHDLHLRLRRAYGDDHLLGDVDWHHDRLADRLFGDSEVGPGPAD
jgi:alkylation response protein AidB-like acyl-CoA dehydrogenase